MIRLATIAMVMLALVTAGCVRITDADGNVARISMVEGSLTGVVQGTDVQQSKLKAMVKGSIYETGDLVTVFGTCVTDVDEGYPNSTGTLSAWYPNGTVMFSNVTMQNTWDGVNYQEGYFLYTAPMDPVPGTYLTEFQCSVPEYVGVAKAWGEWQNPLWVRRIGEIQDTVNVTQQQILDTQQQVAEFANNTQEWFNTTWQMVDNTTILINQTFNNLTTQINYVGVIANSSVDRNDSYLAQLMWMLINGTGISLNNSLFVNETSVDTPVHRRMWNIEVEVRNDKNSVVGFPLVGCSINTTNTPPTVNALMQSIGSDKNARFKHSEMVYVPPGVDFDWTVSCYYR
jgi:hypothetical protein